MAPAQRADNRSLWPRLLLVGLAGAAPFFVVSLFLIRSAYRTAIDFDLQEQRGVAFQKRLADVLASLERYSEAIERTPFDNAAAAPAEHEVDASMGALAADYRGELGHTLGFDEKFQDDAALTTLERRWKQLEHAPRSVTAVAEGDRQLMVSLLALTERTAERSNLLLDDDLDSYYLMDILLMALPKAQARMLELEAALSLGLPDAAPARERRIGATVTLLRDVDAARVTYDARRCLDEDRAFNGTSLPLQANLPPRVASYRAALEGLASLLDAPGDATLRTAELEDATRSALNASFELGHVGASELEHLLAQRLNVIRDQRLRGYLVLVAALILAAFMMGVLIRSLVSTHDVEVAQNQAALAAKEAQLRALGDNLPGGMVYQLARELDGHSRFLYVSAGIEALHGVSTQAVLADPAKLYDLLHEEDRARVLEAERASLAQMTPFKIIARSRRQSDGALRWFEFASAPRKAADGRVIWDGMQLDVTERQLASQLEQRFSQIFDHSPIAMSLGRSEDGTLIAVNDSLLRVSGYSRDEMLGRSAAELHIYADPEQRAQLIERVHAEGRLDSVEVAFRTKSGRVRDVLLWVELITIDDARYALSMSLDVTVQKEATRQQRELEEQLRQTQRLEALGTLAGGIAHDFNNILGAITSLTELSKLENPEDRPLHENLDQILQACGRAAVLVRQILSFSRQQKEERASLQLAPIVNEALLLLRATLPATIALEQAITHPVADVLANATQVHQIVMNLCTNAAHAMRGKQGKIRLEIEPVTLQAGAPMPHVALSAGDYVRLTVSDTGHGMSATTQSRIFEPFFTTKRAGEGTGLGLSVVHGIVKEYGGEITVRSELGRGTTFAIYLPAHERPREERGSVTDEDLPRGNGELILLVDDEGLLSDAIARIVERLGYRPAQFRHSVAALSAFRKEPAAYDALVTDLTMPELTGTDLIREVRAIRAELPVVLVSGSTGSVSPEELRELGVHELLSKPLSFGTLAASLHRALSRGAPTSAASAGPPK
jgi:PAS domain S-box-containing protein